MKKRLKSGELSEVLPDMEVEDLNKVTSFLTSPFKVPHQDAKGNSAHINFYTSPYYLRIAQELKEKIKDFGTMTDVWCAALHYGLKELQGMSGIQSTVWAQLTAWMRIVHNTELEEEMVLAMEKMKETVNRMIGNGDLEEARRMIAQSRFEIEQMPDGYYKNKCLQFIEAQFHGVMKGHTSSTEVGVDMPVGGGGMGFTPIEIKGNGEGGGE